MNKIGRILKSPKTLSLGVLACALLLQSQGYCDTGADPLATEEINATSQKIQNMLFGGTLRKIALTLGFGAGLIQAFMSGSIRPLLIYGGLGLAVCFLPYLVKAISGL